MASIKYKGQTLTYIKASVTTTKVTLSDGTVLSMSGSVNATTILAAYTALKAPVVPPVVIIKPPVGSPTIIGNKELAVLSDVQGVNFQLKPGIYTDRSDWKNLRNVSIDATGVQFQTGGRAIQMNGNVNGIILSNPSFKDISDYCIDFWASGSVKYTGLAGSFIDGFSLLNATAENCGTVLHVDGGITSGSQYGLIKNAIVKALKFFNSGNPGNAVYLGNAMDYDISGSVIDNVNMSDPAVNGNGVHNGIFQLNGNGKFYNNKGTNSQGEFLRAWLHSQEGTKLVEIFNSIYWNSKKYGMIELQATPDMVTNGYKPANAKVYQNVAGKLNNVKDWEGQLLDLYNFGGTLEYYNNLGFEMNTMVSGTTKNTPLLAGANMINNMSDTKIITNTGNKYFTTQAQAVSDVITFKSLTNGIGAQ